MLLDSYSGFFVAEAVPQFQPPFTYFKLITRMPRIMCIFWIIRNLFYVVRLDGLNWVAATNSKS